MQIRVNYIPQKVVDHKGMSKHPYDLSCVLGELGYKQMVFRKNM